MVKIGVAAVLLICLTIFLSARLSDSQGPVEGESAGFSESASPTATGNFQSCADKPPLAMLQSRSLHSDTSEWQLVWSDEFSGDCLDPLKWTPEDWAAEKNNELQYYTPSNVQVSDGRLILTSKREKLGGRSYTSGAVHTKEQYSFLYGKVEMRAKLPAGQGVFPAFWMMTDRKDTWLPEVDIMEMLGHQPDEIWMVSHWLNSAGTLSSASQAYKGPDFSEDFHLFGLEWTPDSLVWLVDGKEKFRITDPIPREPMYLYLNTAIGGDWPGSPDASTRLPAAFEIDYVRVFQTPE